MNFNFLFLNNRAIMQKTGEVNIHFTVSPEHKALFEQLVADKTGDYEEKFSVKYDISFSVQKPSTDTVAVDMENNPFRDKNGNLLFRPGGHGALIENLNDVDADVVFVKNIDNVVPDSRLKALDKDPQTEEIRRLWEEIERDGDCVSLKELAVGGGDLLAAGMEGKEIGETLRRLLELVLEDPSLNRRELLLEKLRG